ncbi:MAG: hypothetical protein QM628_00315 [Propionicimonas sp.]
MAAPSRAALNHLRSVSLLQALALRLGRRAWSRIDPAHISESWTRQIDLLIRELAAVQVQAATEGAGYTAAALAETGEWIPPRAFANPRAFAGWLPDLETGLEAVPLNLLLYTPAIKAKELIAGGLTAPQALTSARGGLDRLLASGVADTSRQAAATDIGTRPGVGYVRQLVGASCPRCVVLAGRWYRWNEGFDRHPQDDCLHTPATQAASNGLVTDPYEYFHSLSEAEQNRRWGQADAQAIRDGADIFRVTNSRRGRTSTGVFTSEGMGRRGFARQSLNPRQRRLTPEGIYRLHPNREDALRELERHGYILPGGQNPLGSIKGAYYEGYGQMGRGGTRKAASQAVLEARRTGVRDPRNRYTMTAAERRDYDIEQRYQAVLAGRSPFVSPAFGRTPDPTGLARGYGASSASGITRPPTPAEAAMVEADYRSLVARRTATAATPGGAGGGSIRPPAPPAAAGGQEEARLPIVPPADKGQVHVPYGVNPERHELDTAERLTRLGKDVVFRTVSTTPGVKNPDIILGGRVWEMKSPIGAGRSTISHQFARARKQTNRLVLDLNRTPLNDEDVLAEVRRRVAWSNATITEVLVILKDQTGILLSRV